MGWSGNGRLLRRKLPDLPQPSKLRGKEHDVADSVCLIPLVFRSLGHVVKADLHFTPMVGLFCAPVDNVRRAKEEARS